MPLLVEVHSFLNDETSLLYGTYETTVSRILTDGDDEIDLNDAKGIEQGYLVFSTPEIVKQ